MNSPQNVPQSPIIQSDIKAQLAYDLWAKFNPIQIKHLLETVKSLQPGDRLSFTTLSTYITYLDMAQ